MGGKAGPGTVALGRLAAGQRVEYQLWAEGGAAARLHCSFGGRSEAQPPLSSPPLPPATATAEGVVRGTATAAAAGEHGLLLDVARKGGYFDDGMVVCYYQWRLL